MEAWDGGRHLSCLNGQAGRLLCEPELAWELEGREICQRNTSDCQCSSPGTWSDKAEPCPCEDSVDHAEATVDTAWIQGTRPFSLSAAARAILGVGGWGDNGGKQKLTLQDVAELIRKKECRRVVVMAGAGISTPSGIPDFRSPGSGLYSNLEQYNIPYPEAIFELMYFFVNPKPFFTLAKELYPGNYRPNYAHYFLRLLHDKGLLLRLYTQNIDGLERVAGIPPDKLVEAHGTFATATCTVCRRKFPGEDFRGDVMADKVPHCPVCTGVIKPDIVFFGEELPQRFFLHVTDFPMADLLFIIGTSLELVAKDK
ncbi:NAD-dependent protein deacetylase sirtuin-3, mitochondrial isoform 3-T3 [Morphnus guianensis]